MDIATWRDEFPVITEENRIHLNNCSAAPIPKRGLEARRECERVWIEKGNPWETWLTKVNEAKQRFADLINADPDEIAVTLNATHSLAQLASALEYDTRSEIVTTDLEFPTVPQFWRAQERRGATLRIAESEDGIRVNTEAFRDTISEQTKLVSTAHAFSFSGGLIDVDAVAEAAHEKGAYLFLDAYQSAGVVPIDVQSQNIDILTSGTLKFLLGGPGIAFLYVDRELANQLEPMNMGWFSTDDIFGFETESPTFAEGARRFELGTPQATVAYTATAGLELIQEVSVDTIRRRTQELTGQLIEEAQAKGFSVNTPVDSTVRGSVVNIPVKNLEEAESAFLEQGFNISTRAGGLRFSPHFYNTSDEISQAIDTLVERASPA